MIVCRKHKKIVLSSRVKAHHKGSGTTESEIIEIQKNHIEQLRHVILGLQEVIENQQKKILELSKTA